jgi:hypothetical protein
VRRSRSACEKGASEEYLTGIARRERIKLGCYWQMPLSAQVPSGQHTPSQQVPSAQHTPSHCRVVPHTQCPETHVPWPHSLPQVPQLLGSVAAVVHPVTGQRTWPLPHWQTPDTQTVGQGFGWQSWHCPETQTPWPQLRMQAPQRDGSELVSKQPVGHVMRVDGHTHTPALHVAP